MNAQTMRRLLAFEIEAQETRVMELRELMKTARQTWEGAERVAFHKLKELQRVFYSD